MTSPWICIVGATLLLAACGDDGPGAAADDGGTARIIVTTTTVSAGDQMISDAGQPTLPSVPPSTETAPTTTPPPTPPPTTTTPPTTTPPTIPAMGNPVVAVVPVASFDQPVDLVARPGDDRWFVVQQGGQVVMFDGQESTTVADLADRLSTGGERGLLGLEFDPTGTLAYVNYTRTDGATTIAEFPVADDGRFDVASERIVLTVDQPYGNHNAGDLQFGPDGMLYIGLGDGGSANDPERRASDPRQLLGSMLRIDPAPSGDLPYTIPADNPFASGPLGDIEGAPEVWAWGLRNPWKFDFDRRNGDLWIADVGQNRYEEIDLVSPTADHPAGWGVDFGWSGFEGTEALNTDVADSGRVVLPVLTYEHGSDGCSVSGGVPYVGTSIPELLGGYVYSDYCSGRLWALDLVGQRNVTLLDGLDAVTAVRTGPDGEIYVVQISGDVLRLVAA
jgi:glucose/arabinose dehydrogenase